MITIRLIDARRELSLKCRELFTNERIAKEIYGYLCDGLEECEEVEPERKNGEWIKMSDADGTYWCCSECGEELYRLCDKTNFCPNCGAEMRKETEDDKSRVDK